MKYKFVLISVGAFLVFSVVAGILLKRPGGPPPPQVTVVRPAPTMGINQPTNVTFSFSFPVSLPVSLPYYSFTDYSKGQIEKIVQSNLKTYNISASSSSLLRSGVFYESWHGNGVKFSFSQDTTAAVISFQQYYVSEAPHTTEDPVVLATRFITALFRFQDPLLLSHTSTTNEFPAGLLILDKYIPSAVSTVAFSYMVNGYPLVSPPHATNATSALIDNHGIIRSATILTPPLSVSPAGTTKLLTQKEILLNLASYRGTIVSTDDLGRGTTGKVDFQSFLIDKLAVVYRRHENLLSPGFLLHGQGTDSKGNNQEATFFLWASAL